MNLLEVSLTSLAAALLCTPLCMYVARTLHVVDHPGPLKPQSATVPYLGGVAVFVALLAAMWNRLALLEPLALATAIGVADDVVDLPPGIRLVGQGVVGLVTMAVVTTRLPSGAAVVVGILSTMVLMNGVNMVDGIDSLATAVVAISAAGFAILHGGSSRELAVAMVAASAGFLVYNRPPARVYLGDGGSYLFGAALAELLALSWAPGARPAVGVGALLLVAVPVAELGVTVLRRVRAGRHLVTGDRGHSYDRMMAGGATVSRVVLVFVGVQVLL
jgi:UDP-GlcNAc:undecaprenyl-phosphate GlcNAc-1-phosphate transferase